jgi:hypothetical protein
MTIQAVTILMPLRIRAPYHMMFAMNFNMDICYLHFPTGTRTAVPVDYPYSVQCRSAIELQQQLGLVLILISIMNAVLAFRRPHNTHITHKIRPTGLQVKYNTTCDLQFISTNTP